MENNDGWAGSDGPDEHTTNTYYDMHKRSRDLILFMEHKNGHYRKHMTKHSSMRNTTARAT